MHLYIGILVVIIVIIIFLCPQTRAKLMKKACDKCHAAPPAAIEPYRANSCIGTFDCIGEDFTASGDIAANTMWSGYQYRTALPRGYIQ